MTKITVCSGDLPSSVRFGKAVAVDTETMGLNLHRDRLCLVQIGDGDGNVWLVQIKKGKKYPNLMKLLTDKKMNRCRLSLKILCQKLPYPRVSRKRNG